ncbi:DUF4192 family protein [Pseudoclavibacter caeni]|jgi:hypothetical protein|uniref:DUF4192 family protein n=1 Tax=Pseudoclavibacter caeni TaxID=908846 RepID=A0A7C8FUL0_9MICO|nr:DUF4192 family protein [Pseudoclavibacter caeni]KAB1632294.1 DUF4192 family protein [Pseudoclavibacter caeni]NYJ97524.1 hypothetical protein [Pseudoclavibacter caeni]
MKTTVLRPSSSAQLLAALPALAGFTPRRDLVVVLFAGRRSRGCFRVDLPVPGDARTDRELARVVLDLLARLPEVTGVMPVACTPLRCTETDGHPHRSLHKAIAEALSAAGVRLLDSCFIAADGWGSFLDPGVPVEGRPLALIEQEPMRLDAMLAIDHAVTDLDDAGVPPAADPDWAERTGAAVVERERRLPARLRLQDAERACEVDLLDLLERLGRQAGAFPESDPRLQRLVVDLAVVAGVDVLREMLLLGLAFGPDAIVQARQRLGGMAVRGPALMPVIERILDEPLAFLLQGLVVTPPDRGRLHRATEVLRLALGRVAGGRRDELVAMLAWLWWALGVSSVAERLVAPIRRRRPDLLLVLLFGWESAEGLLPQWATTAESGDPAPASTQSSDAGAS